MTNTPQRTNPLWNLTGIELDDLTEWATTNHTDLPLYGRLYLWADTNGYQIDPWSIDDTEAFRWVRTQVADRILTTAMTRLRITQTAVEAAGVRVMPA